MALSVNDLGKEVVAAGLLPADDLQALVAARPADARPRLASALAKLLVEDNRLTRYQADELLAGRGPALVLGEYVIQDKIGAGGMGQVLKAVHRKMGRTVALKLISAAAMKDEAAIKRFHREVKAAARLEHENIVTAHTAGEARGMHYLVMQYVEGVDLSDRVKKDGPLSVDLALDCICQAARGLAYAHSEGIIHRDIKPANLLLDKKGVVKILDMGLARIDDGDHDGLTGTEQVLGTVDYMSPEQAVSTRDCDARADIYSLGCTLWYLLTATKMYGGDSPIQRLMQHREAPLPSLLKARDEIPWALEKLFHKMVAKKPDDRVQTMDEVVQEIEHIRGGPETSRTSALDEDTSLGQFFKTIGGTGVTRPRTQTKTNTEKSSAVDGDTLDYSDSRKTLPSTGRQVPPWQNAKVLMGVGAAFVLILAGIIIILRNNKGEEVGRVQVPERGSFEVQNQGTAVRSQESAKSKNPKSQISNSDSAPPLAKAPFDAKQARVHQDNWAKYLGTPVESTNSIGMKLSLIPPGEFLMGSTPEQIEATVKAASPTAPEIWLNSIRSEGPQHRVQITRPFQLGATEVTIGQFKRFIEATKYVPDAEKLGGGTRRDSTTKTDVTEPALTWRAPGYEVTDDSPVTQVTWNDALAFCRWLHAKEKTTYRLPTEAEWEYACRAGTATVFPFGDDPKPVGTYAWSQATAGRPHAVGTKLANAFGLYDMLGNVMEFCQDWHALNWYETSPTNDPVGPSSGAARVVRGGHVGNTGPDMRPAFRYSKASATTRSNSFGFRVVREMALPPSLFSTPSATPPADVDRKAAEWVLARGGHVYVAVKGKVGPEISVSSELPAEAFELRVFLEYGMKPPMTDADYAKLGNLPHLQKSSMSVGSLSETRLKWLESLPKLDSLDFSSRLIEISDAALERLTRLTNLTYLRFGATNVSDAGLPYIARCTKLGQLHLVSAPITDAALPHLESLKSLGRLDLRGTKVTAAGIAKLQKALPNCKIEWDGVSKSITNVDDPAFQQWMKDVAALPAEKQIEAVAKKLQELNPGFDGKVSGFDGGGNAIGSPKIENGVVTEFGFITDRVTDISPVGALQGLRALMCTGPSATNRGKLVDLSPLRGMRLTRLNCSNSQVADFSPLQGMPLTWLGSGATNVSDLAPLKGMPLTTLWCSTTQVADLTPLVGMPLTNLSIHDTPVSDLSPLKGLPLKSLNCYKIKATDLSPLQGMNLTEILLTPKDISRGLDIVRQMKSLTAIGVVGSKRFPPDEFWKRYDAGEFGKPITGIDDPGASQIDAARATAEWAIAKGGLVSVESGGKSFSRISAVDGLPAGPFALTGVMFDKSNAASDADLPRILQLPTIKELALNGKSVTPAGIGQLSTLPALTSLTLSGRKSLDEATVDALVTLTTLTHVGLHACRPSADQVTKLKVLPNMIRLRISYDPEPEVADLAVARIAELPNLEELNLDHTNLTDAGLEKLSSLKKLKRVNVAVTQVTAAGVATLQTALPGCKIFWDLPK